MRRRLGGEWVRGGGRGTRTRRMQQSLRYVYATYGTKRSQKTTTFSAPTNLFGTMSGTTTCNAMRGPSYRMTQQHSTAQHNAAQPYTRVQRQSGADFSSVIKGNKRKPHRTCSSMSSSNTSSSSFRNSTCLELQLHGQNRINP